MNNHRLLLRRTHWSRTDCTHRNGGGLRRQLNQKLESYHCFSSSTKSKGANTSSSSQTSKTAKYVAKSSKVLLQEPKALAIGTFAGMLGSLAGMGGGFVMIPLMTKFLRLSQHQAHGTSLTAVIATGCAGAFSYQDQVDYMAAMAVATTAMITAAAGARTTVFLSETALKRALGVLLLIMGPAVPAKAYLLDSSNEAEILERHETHDSAQKSFPSQTPFQWSKYQAPAAIGLASGYLAGLFGVGGGTLVVPALIFTSQHHSEPGRHYHHHQALATSLAAMTFPAAVGTITHARAGNVAFRVAPPLALGALCGAYLGGKVAMKTDEKTLRWGFSALLVALGVRTISKTL